MEFFLLEIAGLLHSKNWRKKFFKRHTCYLAIAT